VRIPYGGWTSFLTRRNHYPAGAGTVSLVMTTAEKLNRSEAGNGDPVIEEEKAGPDREHHPVGCVTEELVDSASGKSVIQSGASERSGSFRYHDRTAND
jgi:RNA 3'-terminal phosphate cyclase